MAICTYAVLLACAATASLADDVTGIDDTVRGACSIVKNHDWFTPGNNLDTVNNVASGEACQALCKANRLCSTFTWGHPDGVVGSKNVCWLKKSSMKVSLTPDSDVDSGACDESAIQQMDAETTVAPTAPPTAPPTPPPTAAATVAATEAAAPTAPPVVPEITANAVAGAAISPSSVNGSSQLEAASAQRSEAEAVDLGTPAKESTGRSTIPWWGWLLVILGVCALCGLLGWLCMSGGKKGPKKEKKKRVAKSAAPERQPLAAPSDARTPTMMAPAATMAPMNYEVAPPIYTAAAPVSTTMAPLPVYQTAAAPTYAVDTRAMAPMAYETAPPIYTAAAPVSMVAAAPTYAAPVATMTAPVATYMAPAASYAAAGSVAYAVSGTCANCGNVFMEDSAFCRKCGQPRQ